MIRQRACWCLLLLTGLLIAAGSTSATPAPTATEPPLQALVADVWPWGYMDDQEQPQGIIVDLFRELESRSGKPIELRLLPHQRVLLELEQGQGDLSVLFANPAADRFAERSAPVLQSRFFLMAPRERTGDLNLASLAGEPVGFIRGTYYGRAFEADQAINKIAVSSLEQGVMMLQAGRLQAMISSEQTLYHTFQKLALLSDDWRLALHSEQQTAYLYRQRQVLPAHRAAPLVEAIEQLRASGELQHLVGVPALDQPPAAHSAADRQSSSAPPRPVPE